MMDLHTIKIVVLIVIPFLLPTMVAVVHAAQKDFGTFEKKIAWGAVAWIPFIGFVIYLFFGYRKGKKFSK